MRLSTLVALALLGMLGCSLRRAPIIERSDGGTLDIDATSTFDVPLPPGPDVPPVEIDAPTGCATSCGVGERCEGSACVCASDLCAGDRMCVAGACVPCGGPAQACCADLACRDGRTCEAGLCPASRCNTAGAPCCEGDRCDGLTCVEGMCTVPCGGPGQACCPTGEACGVGLSCQGTFELPPRDVCQSCGAWGEVCCPGGRCEGSLGCGAISGRCF